MALNNSDIIQSIINGTTSDATITPSSNDSLQQTKADRISELLNAKQSTIQEAKASLLDQVLERKFAPKIQPTQHAGLNPDQQRILAIQAEERRNALINAPQNLSAEEQWQKTLSIPPKPSEGEIAAVSAFNTAAGNVVSNVVEKLELDDFAGSVRRDAAATALEQKSKQQQESEQKVFNLEEYKRLVRGAESGGYVDPNTAQNPNSSALGTYQFTENTWNDLVTNYPGRGLTVDGRTDGAQQEIAADLLTNENKVNLENKNIPVTNGNMYVMHALGAGDGSMMLQAAMNGDTRLAANLVSSEVVTSNPTWFRGNPTSQGLVDHLSGLVGARVTDQSTFTTKTPTKQVVMSDAGRRLAEAFEKKDRGSPITGSPTERLEAMQAAEAAKAKLKGPMITDVAKDLLRKGYTKAGELHKAYEEYQKKEESKKEPEFITPRSSSREPHYTDIGSEDFANVELPSFDDGSSPGFDDAVLKPFEKPTFDTEAKIIFKNEETGVIEYEKNMWGYEDPYTGKTVTGLNKVAAEAYAMHALTDTEAQIAGAPDPGSVGHAFNKATKEFGPVAATMAKAVNRVIGGPTTLTQLADSNNISPEDVVRYKVISKASTLTTEQQTFKDSDTYKTLTKLESKAAHNLETSKLLDEFAEQWKKQFPTNERNPRGALKAYHLIAESEGTIAAVMNALKNDKASLIDMGWSSVPYTLALALGNIPVQLGLFTALAVGMAEEAIVDWKALHNGEEPSAEIAQEIMLLAGVRLAAEKAAIQPLKTFLGKIPGLGGPLVWSQKVNKAVTKTVSPKVTGLKTFSQKYLGGPAKKAVKGTGAVAVAIARVPLWEATQEGFDVFLEEVQQTDADLFSKDKWSHADPSKIAQGFLLGGFGVITTGAGVKVFDIATKTAIKITDAFKTKAHLQKFNDRVRKLREEELSLVTDKLQKIEDYKNTDPKVVKDFETVESELKDFAAIARETPPEIGPNGELITDNTYFKEQFLTYELQILKGELTPEEALDEIYTNFNSEFETKQALYDNLKAQIPETLAYKDTVPGQFDVAKLKKVQAEIAKIEVDTKLSDEDKELASRDLREEEQRLFTKLDSPTNVDIAAIEAERLQTLKENLEQLLESKDYEQVIVKTGLFKKELKSKGDLKKQEKKKGEPIGEEDFTVALNELVVEGKKSTIEKEQDALFKETADQENILTENLNTAQKEYDDFHRLNPNAVETIRIDKVIESKQGLPEARKPLAASFEKRFNAVRDNLNAAKEELSTFQKETEGKVQGKISLTLRPPIVEGVELAPPDIGYANIDPSGKFKVGDIVQIDSQDPEILAAQGFKIEYFLSEQERDGKVHVKLKGRSATVPIDQLYSVAPRLKSADKASLTREEQLAELSKRDLTEDQQKQFNKVIEKEIENLKQRAGETARILGSSADSFENISNEEINPTSSLQEKSEDSALPEVARQFYKAEINRRRIQAERTANEQLAPNEKSLGIVKGEILEGQSAQWKGLHTYYQELVDAYFNLKDDTVVRDQQIAAIRSNMSTHATNLNSKLAAFQTAQNTLARDGFKDNSPFAVAVIGTQPNPDTREMQYDVVTNMTAKEIEDARANGGIIWNIGPQSKSLVDALTAEAEYGSYIMGVVEGYENTPMAAKAVSKKERFKREQDVLNRLIKLYANQPKKRKEMSDEDIASLGVDSPIVKDSKVQWNVGGGFPGKGGIEVVEEILTGPDGKSYAKIKGINLTVPIDELVLVEDKKGPTLQEQLETATNRATELSKIPEEELTEEEANELKKLKSEIGDLTLKINQEGKQSSSSTSTGKGSKFKGKGSSSKKPPTGSDEVAPNVRIRSIIKRNIKESIITVKNLKIVKTFIEGAKEAYNYIVGNSLDEALGLSRALFTDLVQIGSSEKLIKGINTLQDTDFNNDASLKEALMDLGVEPESADILIEQYNDFQGRYDQIIHRDLQQKDRDGNPTKVYYVGDPDDKEIYEVQVLTTNEKGAFEETGEYTKLEGGKVVLRSELMSAEIHALHMPLTPLLRKDELDPGNTTGRLPDQVVFTLMLSAMTFKQQSPNNNRWGDKPFAKEAFLFGGKNQSLMPDEQEQVDQIGYGFHDSAGRMGTAAIQLLEMSAKKIAEDSAIDQAGADLYFDHLGPALGMMAITIADGDSKYFDVHKHIWDFKEPNKPNRVFNNAPEGSTIGYKHLTVRDKTYPNKDVRKALANIVEVSGVDLDISSGPLQKPAKVSKQIKNTFSRIDDEGDVFQALEELNNTVWRKNKAMDVVFDLREHREALYELSDVIRIYGTEEYVDTADGKIKKRWQRDQQGNKIPLHHKDRMLSLTSSNTNKTNTIDELIAAYDLEELDNFHIAYELQNHHRLMQTGRINPQQSKVTRSLVESWEEQEYTLENLWQFKMAVAYNFGIKTDKQYSFNTEFDFDNNIIKKESVLRAVASLQLLNSAKATLKTAIHDGAKKDSAKKIKADKAVELAASQLATAMRDVKRDFPKGDMSLLNGIVGLSEYMKVTADKRYKLNHKVEPVLEGPKKKESFGSSLIYEIDGMSNGWAMNVAQFPMWEKEELWRRMGQVGNYPGKPGTFPFHDVMSPGPYNDLVKLVNEGTTLDNAWKYYDENYRKKSYSKLAPRYIPKKNKDGTWQTKRQVFNEEFTQINAALTVLYPDFRDQETLRDVVKYPFIMKMYGGGIKRISGDVTTDIIKELTTTIGEVQKVYAELKKSEPDPALIAKLRDEYNFFKDKEFGEHSAQEYYERSVVNLAEHLDTLGAFDKSTKIKGVTSKAEFLNRIKKDVFTNANSTAFDTQLNTEKLQAVISTTIAPRLEFGLETLLEDTKEPRDAIVEMGEILHEVFMAHYEKAYKDKVAEVNKELATKHKLGTLIDAATGKKYGKAPQRDLTKIEIRNLIQDTNGDLIKVYPQFAGPLSRIAPDDDYNLGFVDLTNTEFIRDTTKTDQEIGDSPKITSEEVVVQYNDPNTSDKVNTVRTTANILQFIKPGVAALIREIINIDAAILTASIIKRDTNKFILPTHDGVGSTPENLIPFAEDYNDFYKNFNLENSIISITFDQVEKVIGYSSKEIMDIVKYRLFNDSFNNQNKEKPEDKETLEQRLKVLRAIKDKVVKKREFIQDGNTGQFVSAQMQIMRSPTEERENLSEETVENTLREQVRKSVEKAPKNPPPPKKRIAKEFNDQINNTQTKPPTTPITSKMRELVDLITADDFNGQEWVNSFHGKIISSIGTFSIPKLKSMILARKESGAYDTYLRFLEIELEYRNAGGVKGGPLSPNSLAILRWNIDFLAFDIERYDPVTKTTSLTRDENIEFDISAAKQKLKRLENDLKIRIDKALALVEDPANRTEDSAEKAAKSGRERAIDERIAKAQEPLDKAVENLKNATPGSNKRAWIHEVTLLLDKVNAVRKKFKREPLPFPVKDKSLKEKLKIWNDAIKSLSKEEINTLNEYLNYSGKKKEFTKEDFVDFMLHPSSKKLANTMSMNKPDGSVEFTRLGIASGAEAAAKFLFPALKIVQKLRQENKKSSPSKNIDDLLADEINDDTVRGSFVPQGDTHVKSTRELDDITRNNVRGLFDQMSSLSSKYYSTKEEQNEHTQVLSSILNMLSDGFDETNNIQLTYQQIAGITQGTYEVASERMTISVSQGGPLTRNGQSPAEVYVHEMLHAMTSLAADEYPLVTSRIDKLYNEVSASLTKTYGKGKEWKVFLPAGTRPVKLASKKETDMAKAQYKYVFQGKEEDRIHEFLAYAATNRNLAAYMKKTTRPGQTTLLGKVLETIQAVVDAIREMVGNKVYKATGSSSFAEAIAITEKLVAVQNKHKSKHKQLESKLYQGLDALDEITRDFANTVGLNILKATVNMDPNTASKNPMPNLATGVINAPFLALSDDAASLAMRQAIDATLNKTLRGIAHEVGGGALSPQLKEQLLQSKINISKQRQEAETFYTKWFKNIWKSIPPKDMDEHGMSFETREALTDVLLRTDLSSLKLANLGFMGPGSTQRIMDLVGFDKNNIQARGKLKRDIKRKLRLSGNSPAIQYAEELGKWIATGKRGKLGNPYTNAYSIAFDHIKDPSEEQTNFLDAYATIVSLGELDERSVSLVKGLSNNEFSADATNNGIIDMLDTHVVYKTKSRKDLFDGDPIQMVKGYIVERMDNLTSIKLGPASDKDNEAGLGYKDNYPLGKVDKDQTFDTLYINRNIPEVADISGIMSTTNQRNMGTTLTEILMRNPAYQYPNTKKPNFKKITTKIEEIKKRQAALAKQLKHDPNFSKFTPIRDQNNRITDYRVMMDHQSTKEILKPDLEIQNVFAHMQSRLVDRTNSIENDIQTINLLVHEQAELLKNHGDQFVNLLDESSAYIDRYRKMPRVIREYISKFAINGKFMVREDIIDKVFGYTQLDVTQLKILQGESYGAQKAKQIAGLTHHLIRETVGYGKNRVVLAIPQVVIGNLFSNIAQLSMRKIPIQYIFYKIIEGIQQYRKYSKDRKELAKLEHLIETKRLNPKTSAEALQVERLKVRIKKNKLHKMSKAGLNSLIVEDLNEAQIDGYFNRMKRVLFKGKYKHIGDRIPRTVQSIAATLFFAKGSVPYEMSRQLVQMTDFLGRYVMIEHAVNIKGRDFKDAMHEALDAFVLFDEALLGPLEAVDAVGVTSFLSYFLRNQRAVNQLVKTSPSSVALSAIVQHITGVPTLGNVNSAWLSGDFSPNLMQLDDLFDEANNITGFEVVSDFTKML